MGTRAGSMHALVMDVDGVLTDGALWMDEEGRHMKRFSIRDGMGLKLLLHAGIRLAIISGHASPATLRRFQGLGIDHVLTGVEDKGAAFDAFSAESGIEPARIAAIGDDLNDLPMLRRAGFAVTVPDAPEEVLRAADHVTEARGGHGAVRELAEHLLHARGVWDEVVRRFEG